MKTLFCIYLTSMLPATSDTFKTFFFSSFFASHECKQHLLNAKIVLHLKNTKGT